MGKLLRAGFRRTLRNPVMWIATLCALLFGVVCASHISIHYGFADDSILLAGILIFSVNIALVCGIDFGGGAFRNKFISGYGRVSFYVSEYIVTVSVALFFCFITMAIAIIPNVEALNRLETAYALRFLFGIPLVFLMVSTMIFAITMMFSQRTLMIAATVLFSIFLCVIPEQAHIALSQPEYLGVQIFVDGEFIWPEDAVKNPNYLSSPYRELYTAVYNATPFGALMRYESALTLLEAAPLEFEGSKQASYLRILPIYAVCTSLLFFSGGLLLFGKRNFR